MRIVSVLPETWVGLHKQHSMNCWCKPSAEIHNGTLLIIHNNPKGDIDTKWGVYDEDIPAYECLIDKVENTNA